MKHLDKDKDEQLGMNAGTANHRLRKMLIFHLLTQLGQTKCYRCGEEIAGFEELSIDHKSNWMYSDNPLELFFDVTNIAFSHRLCNQRASRCNVGANSNTGFKGVYYEANRKKPYAATLYTQRGGVKKSYRLGRYDTPEAAALAYDAKAIELLGERAVTNAQLGLV